MEEEKNTKKNDVKEEPNELKKITEELEECKAKREEYLNGWKRERSDFLNHKKEEMERIGIIIKYANEELILKILPILDNIFLAESQVPEEYKEEDTPSSKYSWGQASKAWVQGFLQIKKQLSDLLFKEGIERIEVLGKEFDPNTMEAVDWTGPDPVQSEEENSGSPSSADSAESGVVVEEVQRGYTLHGKVIRPAKVKVTK